MNMFRILRMTSFPVLFAIVGMLLMFIPASAAQGDKNAPGSGSERLKVTVLREGIGLADALDSGAQVHDKRGVHKQDSVNLDSPTDESVESGLIQYRGDTRLDRVLYVSNMKSDRNGNNLVTTDKRVYNTLWIEMTWGTSSGGSIEVTSQVGDDVTIKRNPKTNPAVTHAFVQVIEPISVGTVPNGAIEADDGDTITVTAGTVEIEVTVDGEAPTITNITPAHDSMSSKQSVLVSFTVTDDASGLRTDRESGTDADDDDIHDEPLSLSTHAAADITLHWDVDKNGVTKSGTDQDDTRRGSDDWVEVRRNHSYSLSYTRRGIGTGKVYWTLSATDRVGNRVEIDGDEDQTGSQPYIFSVDRDGPDANGNVYAGIGFDDDKGDRGGEVHDNKSILLLFENEGRNDIDPLDTDTIDVSDFRVEGNTVVGVIHPNLKRNVDSKRTAALTDDVCGSHTGIIPEPGVTDETKSTKVNEALCIDTRNRVYLVLRDALDEDDTPEVSIVGGGIEDADGNDNVRLRDVEAKDKIAPSVDVTVTGDVQTEGRPLARKKFTVSVATDERLRALPRVYMAHLNLAVDTNGNRTYTVGNLIDPGSVTTKKTGLWEIDFETRNNTTLAAVLYYAEDRGGNKTFSPGWDGDNGGNPRGDELNIGKLDSSGLLVQYDGQFAKDGQLSVNIDPDTDDTDGKLKTESSNPSFVLDFGSDTGGETNENGLKAGGKTYHEGTDDDGATIQFDSYKDVVIDSAVLDGEDVSYWLSDDGVAKFFLSLSSVSVGKHTLTLQVSDTAENAKEFKVHFEVLERGGYRIDLRPGWNLISLPAHPANPALEDVLPSEVKQALSYRDGEWFTSSWDSASGQWVGTLAEITSGYGYWVASERFTSIDVDLPEAMPTSVLPTVPVTQGWNLLGIVDFRQAKAGSDLTTADSYFGSIEWALAYTFDTHRNRWTKLNEGAKANVKTGVGYWVWVTKEGVLVP